MRELVQEEADQEVVINKFKHPFHTPRRKTKPSVDEGFGRVQAFGRVKKPSMEEEIAKVRQKFGRRGADQRAVDSDAESDEDDEVEQYMRSMAPKDPRKPLRADAVKKGYKRCLLFKCDKFLNPGAMKCGRGCMAKDYCVCGACGATYDPMQVVACERCSRVLPHDTQAYQALTQSEVLRHSLKSWRNR